ncbi:Tat pathway signal protein [Streptomyces sp. NPDC001250]|uniref:alpha/beta hydrolase family protein n=1 Tax=unclassified Streptomyces TaxID=2593676 RepID=UPI003321210A
MKKGTDMGDVRQGTVRGIKQQANRRPGMRSAAACTVIAISVVTAAALPAQAATPPGPAAPAGQLSLPAPTGKYPVGEVNLHLADHTRTDPWHGGGKDRELMASVYYPAARAEGRAAPYMLPKAAEHFDAVTTSTYLQLDVPKGKAHWAATRTHAVQGVPVAGGRSEKRPVLIYSPGLGEPRTWGTTLVADLASRGYIVVTIDNTYESPEVQFPNGLVATMVTPKDPNAFMKKSLDVRVADTRFVLDQLSLLNSGKNPDVDRQHMPRGLAGALDLSRAGMFGHSSGGTTAAMAMDADSRISAGINMDGNLTNMDGSLMPVAEHGLARPFLLMGKDGTTDTGPGWKAFRAHTHGWNRQLTLRGSQHASFTDAEALLPQLDLPSATLKKDIGTIDPATAIRTNEAYVAAYFDHWLRGRGGHLLDGPSSTYPDMKFVS